MLQNILSFKAHIPKFIFKKQLLYMPIAGLICWAYDFPSVTRYTKEEIGTKPGRKGEDRKLLEEALRRFHNTPGSIVNFVEGTRYDSLKARRRQSSYRFLLPPRAGGLTVILQSVGEQLHEILDLTLAYDCAPFNFWDFMCGKCRRIIVQVRHIPAEDAFGRSGRHRKTALPTEAAQWINNLWQEKDQMLLKLRTELNRERLTLHEGRS